MLVKRNVGSVKIQYKLSAFKYSSGQKYGMFLEKNISIEALAH